MQTVGRTSSVVVGCLALLLSAGAAFGAIVPTETLVSARQFANPVLEIDAELIPAMESARSGDLDALGAPLESAFIDRGTGRWATLLPVQPLIPGNGVGNDLSWAVAPRGDDDIAAAAEAAFLGYVEAHAAALGFSPAEFGSKLNVSVYSGGEKVLVYVPRVIDGVPVRDSFVTATISHGNLVLMGSEKWADVNVSARPALDEAAARLSLERFISDLPIDGRWGDTELVIVPSDLGDGSVGYRLVYSLKPRFENDLGHWEALVDAHSGELLAFQDTNHYAARHVVGGVHPVSNDGNGPDGTEQTYPMPYADLRLNNGNSRVSGESGNFPGSFAGTVTTSLNDSFANTFVDVNDNCGSLNMSSTGLNAYINLGTSGGDDCVTPGGGGSGNTHSARDTFYHLNRAAEWGRGRSNAGWLNNTLDSNTNISSQCNAFWSGSVNFYRSGGGCGNTGEIAGVINHEWGHGVDDNDNNPNISNPGEGIADVYASLTTGASCIGRGFFDFGNCGGYGDPCTNCSGIRDIDYAKHVSGNPHDVVWSNANCGNIVHCKGYVYSEAIFDLKARDLPALGQDARRANTLTAYLTLIGASNVGTWFTTSGNGNDGCSGSGGYLNYLGADDTDGNINNGTPHMSAIKAAFDRHGIDCNTPGVQNTGCAGAPNVAPNVSTTIGNGEVTLSWPAVAGAVRYQVYRSEGINACNQGNLLLTTTANTSYTDTDLLHGFNYHYSVTALAVGRPCVGPMSPCLTVSPN